MLTAEETQDKDRPLRETVRDTLRTRIFEGHYAPGTTAGGTGPRRRVLRIPAAGP